MVDGSIRNLEKPPGRQPHIDSVEASAFYNSLTDEQKVMLRKIVHSSIDIGIFKMLVILDNLSNGVDTDGEFELYFNSGGEKVRLNDPNDEDLHDLYNWRSAILDN